MRQGFIPSANYLADVNCSGVIGAPDLQQVKNNLLHSAPLGGDGLFGLSEPGDVLGGFSFSAEAALSGMYLGEALGAPELEWTTNGDEVWVPTTEDGLPATVSGRISDYEVSWVETTVEGPGTISFE